MTKASYRMYSANLDEYMRELTHVLGDIDFDHKVTLARIEDNCENIELKKCLIGTAQTEHQLKRQLYVDLLNRLRIQQYRQSFVAEDN
jgi:hypothetical protein